LKYKSLVKKLNLSEEDFETIKAKVSEVEKDTSGEIALAIAPESAHYSYWELLAANIVSAIVIIALLPFSSQIRELYHHLYWQNEPGWIIPAFFVVTCFATILIVFYMANIPALDRLIIPSVVKKSCVTHRAFRYFTESGVYETKEHSGILIFVSYMERQVRLVADTGISSKISQDLWNLIADELAEGLNKGNTKDAFVNAISKCGDLLKENFPPDAENPNELPDGLVILEDAEWY